MIEQKIKLRETAEDLRSHAQLFRFFNEKKNYQRNRRLLLAQVFGIKSFLVGRSNWLSLT